PMKTPLWRGLLLPARPGEQPIRAPPRFVGVFLRPSHHPSPGPSGWLCSTAIEPPVEPMLKSTFFVLRLAAAWLLAIFVFGALWSELPLLGRLEWPVVLGGMLVMALVVAGAISHLGRVRLVAGRIDKATLANRQRRQVEIPLEAGEAFDLVDAAIRELPGVEQVESARDSLQVRAKVERPRTYGEHPLGRWNPLLWFGIPRNQISATVTPGHDSGSVTLICEPESPAWSDWFLVDDGTNFENAEAITRAITRRVAAHRRGE